MAQEIIYDGLNLGALGEVSVTSHREEFGPTPLALGRKVTLAVRVSVTQAGWADNRVLIDALRAAVRKQQGVLQWKNEHGQELLNRPVAVESCDLPEEANTPGVRFQQAELSFSYEAFDLTTQATALVVSSGAQMLTLGSVLEWQESLAVTRFDEMRSERKRSAYQIEVSGFLPVNTALPLATKRAQLLAAKEELLTRLDQKEVRMQYGPFDQTLRVQRIAAKVNQAVDKIEWSFTGEFTRFPDEANYATVEYRILRRDEGADQVLGIAGRVEAETLAKARTSVAGIVTAMLAAYGFSASLVLREEEEESRAKGNADGDTFITYGFTKEYRKPLVNIVTIQRPGGTVTPMGNVVKWEEEEQVERFGAMKNARRMVTRKVRITGQRLADASNGTQARRTELQAVKDGWDAEFAASTMTVAYGSFNRVVRVTERRAEMDQAVRVLDWTLAFEYTLSPDEANYTIADYQINSRDEGADQFLSFSGRIQASSETAARNKLATLRAETLSARGYSGSLVLRQDDEVTAGTGVDGAVFIEFGFTEEYRKVLANLVKYQPTGGEAINLGNLTAWREGIELTRYHPLRSARQEVLATVTIEGVSYANAQQALEARRTELLGIKEGWLAKLNSAEGELTYGEFQKTVKVTSFRADIDQAVRALVWNLTVQYTRLPDESNYATVEYQVAERDEGADKMLTINGRVMANSLTKARDRWAVLVAAVLAGREYDPKLQTKNEEQTAEVSSFSDGDLFLEITCAQEYRKPLENTVTYKAGEAQPVALGNITAWQEGYRATRYSPLHSERSYAGGQVQAKGQYFVDVTLPLEQRTAALLAKKEQWLQLFNVKEGILKHGDFEKTVRIADFTAELDQARRSLVWTLSGEYSRFPNEEGYAFAEYTSRRREDAENGQIGMVFSGRIMAHTPTAAYAKLASLRATVLGGNSGYVQLRKESSENKIEADTDGGAFLEITFDEEYQLATGATLRWELNVTTAEDVASGLVRQTYGGTVTAQGANYAEAETAAKAKARELGDNKAEMQRTNSLSVQDRQTLTTGQRLVTVSFSFEYQVKGSKAFWEVQSEVAKETFGENTERISGSIVAPTAEAANNIYEQEVKALFAGRLMRGEQTGQVRENMSRVNLTNGAVVAGQYEGMWLRLSFSFTVHKEKGAEETAMRYDINVVPDDVTNTKTITLSGTVWAEDAELNEVSGMVRPSGKKTKAEKVLEGFLAGMAAWLGVQQKREFRERHDYFLGVEANVAGRINRCMALEFTFTYTAKLSNEDKILMCELTEAVEHSGVRWVVQNIPDGRPIIQNCGYNAGGRTVTGKVQATSRAAAEAWAASQRSLLEGTYELPPSIQTDFRFLPLTTGIVAGEGANVMICEVGFRFSEILLDEDYG